MSTSKKLKSNLLKQNCYVFECSSYIPQIPDPVPEYFESLDEVTDYDGVKLKHTINPHPITPEYVSSFVGCDYHNDPLSAISTPQKGGVVDLTGIPDLASLDTGAIYNLLQLLRVSRVAPLKPENDDTETKIKDEVDNNG